MDDESGESMELMEEMLLKELGEAELERLVRVDGGEPGVDSRDEGKRIGRNDLLFVEKMMWIGERGCHLVLETFNMTCVFTLFMYFRCFGSRCTKLNEL